MMFGNYKLYVIHSKSSKFTYIGITKQSILKRFARHKNAKMHTPLSYWLKKHQNSQITPLIVDLTESQAQMLETYKVPASSKDRKKLNLLNCKGGGNIGFPRKSWTEAQMQSHIARLKSKKGLPHSLEHNRKVGRKGKESYWFGKKQTVESIRKRIATFRKNNHCAKHYEFINPRNELVKVFNLKNFCEIQKLNYNCMHNVSKRKSKTHQGWQLNNE